MSWHNASSSPRFTARRLLAACAAGAALLLPLAAQAAIVVAASGPSAKSYPPGTKLPDDATITLQAADSVTVLDKNGTRVLKGAGTYKVGSTSGVNRGATFAALTTQRSATRVRTGAVRGEGPDGKPLRPNLWYVDVTAPGTICLTSLANVRAWRPAKDGAATYRLVSASGLASGTIAFSDQSMIAPWDAPGAPLRDGSSYAIRAAGSAEPVTVTFALLPARGPDGTPFDMEDLGAALLERGCTGQLAVMTQTLALPSG
ncbi:hypothetical protein [Novosphingobium colocasiae]|uniref:hypothetical protein n=1 Tax=Novosphingobium colocasiae TaxID=1256513 RepID=UPI0035AE4038